MGLDLDLEDYHPSVLLHCWLGHLICKIVSKMTYNVSSGMLKPYNVIVSVDSGGHGVIFCCVDLYRVVRKPWRTGSTDTCTF